MEANLEAYLDEKGVEYEKFTKQREEDVIEHYYVLEKFVEFDDEFNFMDFAVDNALLGKNEYVNNYLNELNKNNIKYKEVLRINENCLYFSIQCEIEDIKFCSSPEYKFTMEEYEFRKFIKYNTTFEYCGFEEMIEVSNYGLGFIDIFILDSKIVIRLGRNDIEFTQFQDFKEWLAENIPECLRSEDIKIALKD
jgi:hypothetical protein